MACGSCTTAWAPWSTPRSPWAIRLRIDQNVIIGRQDAHLPREQSPFGRLHFGDDAVLFPGCVVLGGANRIGAGSTVGDNSVLTGDTGENEIWAGSPARKVGVRSDG